MCEIKFQVFTTDWEGITGCFEGYFLQLLDNGEYKVAFTNSDNDKEFITTSRENIRFFTGIIDKNGKEIYEGDIYHVGDPNITYTVIRHDSGFIGKQNGSSSYAGLSHWQDRIEVIGNIFEDSHLLEEQHG